MASRWHHRCGPNRSERRWIAGEIAAYRTLVGAVLPAVLGAVPAIAAVLKLVVMPGDARLLDGGVLVTVHFVHLPSQAAPLPPAPRQGH